MPSAAELRKMADGGLTHAQIAAKLSEDLGRPITRTAVSARLSRAGLTVARTRHAATIPWRVRKEHQHAYPARMLRLLGRRLEGKGLSAEDSMRLDGWVAKLDKHRPPLIVAYSPTAGFLYVRADERDDRPNGIPIRARTIKAAELP